MDKHSEEAPAALGATWRNAGSGHGRNLHEHARGGPARLTRRQATGKSMDPAGIQAQDCRREPAFAVGLVRRVTRGRMACLDCA